MPNETKEHAAAHPTVSAGSTHHEIKGVVKPKIVRWIAFLVITTSLVICTVLCILAIWEFTKSDAVWRAIATFIVVSVATGIFTFVNEKLG
jgi:hypothetical protein